MIISCAILLLYGLVRCSYLHANKIIIITDHYRHDLFMFMYNVGKGMKLEKVRTGPHWQGSGP